MQVIAIKHAIRSKPILRIDENSGECEAFYGVQEAARSIADKKEATSIGDVAALAQKISLSCSSPAPFCGYYWREGSLMVAPAGFTNRLNNVIGSMQGGFKVSMDTGLRMPADERVFIGECSMCGAHRLITETMILSNAVRPCGCLDSLRILDRASEKDGCMQKSDIRALVISGGHEDANKQEEPEQDSAHRGRGRPGRPVRQYTVDGLKFVAEYPSAVEACEAVLESQGKPHDVKSVRCGSGNIQRCCRSQRRYAYGYAWAYADEDPAIVQATFIRNIGAKFLKRPVYQYEINGTEPIARFDSIVDAYCAANPEAAKTLSREVLRKRSGCITSCCQGSTKSSCGYGWRYADVVDAENAKMTPPVKAETSTPVTCMLLDTGEILDFDSPESACSEIGSKLERTINLDVVIAACNKGGGAEYNVFWEYKNVKEK